MRPTASAMLQQNNNNNYPCLSMSASTQEMLQKCSKASLPLPGRLELSLGDLPLIRGLRAWALCSKNRRRTGNLLEGGRKAPGATPPSASCPRPADVHLSGECWGMGMDARQARIGALVTVATLKTSEGGGKTQTQCLLLRTEKGSCLYSTRKPGSAAPPVGGKGWLGGKTGGKDALTGRRDVGTDTTLHAEANWVRVRSGRRWRKSGNVSDMHRARLQSRKDDGNGLRLVEKRKDEHCTGNLDRQELEKQDNQKSLEGGLKSHGDQSTYRSSPHSFYVGTKRETQSENELQTSPNKDKDTNHDALRFFSQNEDRVAREKPNAEDKTCGAATNGSTSSSMSCESSSKDNSDGLRLAEETQGEQCTGNLDRQQLEKQEDKKSLGGGVKLHGSLESFPVATKGKTQSEKGQRTSPNKDVHSPKHEDTNHNALRFLSVNEDPPPVSTEKPNVENKTCGTATNRSTSSSMNDDDGLRLVEGRQGEQRQGSPDRQELEKSLGGGIESHGSPQSLNEDVYSPKHEDTNHDALRFLSGNKDPPPDDLVSTVRPNAEDVTHGAATNGSTFSSMSSESSSKVCNGLRLMEERQDEQGTGNLDHQELEKQEDQKSLGGGIESHGSTESLHVGTKRETKSEKELQSSQNVDEDTNHDALMFLSQNEDEDLVSREKPNAEDKTCEAATLEEISYCSEPHESTSSSMSSESSDFGQNEPDVSVLKETQDKSQRFSSQTEVPPSPDKRRGCSTAQPINEEETQDRLEPEPEPDEDERTCRTLIKEDGGGGERRKRRTQDEETKPQEPDEQNQEADTERSGPPTSHSHSRANPASFPKLPLSSLPVGSATAGGRSLGSQSESEEMTTSTSDDDDDDDDEEEEEFGVFMQADGEADWDQGLKTPVHCGNRESVGLELGNPAPHGEESSHWTPAGWMDGSFHQWDDSWTAFSQDASEKGGDVGQWWPISAAEQRRDITSTSTSTNQDLTSVFARAFPFPSLSSSSSSSSQSDSSSVPTLSELLRGGAGHHQGLLDDFHDLDKMIGRRFKRANAASRGLLLRTLQLEPLKNHENRHPASRRHSPGLPSANQHAHSAVPKRRLSYDSNRSVTA